MKSFLLLSLLGGLAIADATIIRSKPCVSRSTDCRWLDASESSVKGQSNICKLSYSYLLRTNVTVISKDGVVTTLKEPEEVGNFKTYSRTFYYDNFMSSSEWDRFCKAPCQDSLKEVIDLYGRCS